MATWINSTPENYGFTEDEILAQTNQDQTHICGPRESSISEGMPETEYRDLVTAMNTTVCMGVFKIEILPNSHPLPSGLNVLVENHSISLTKSTLINAFATAREKFFYHLADIRNKKNLERNQAVLMDSSAIMLLAIPEHHTAANARKRVIMAWEKESQEQGRKGIVMDLWILDSMLMSSLNKHTKSPTLWAHRVWLIQRLPSAEPLQVETRCSSAPLRKEREISLVALTAAQIHPRNYSAWAYMRWWIENNPELLCTFGHCPITQGNPDETPFGLPKLANSIQKWCLKNPSDTSGWSFLLYLLTVPGTWATSELHLYGPFEKVSENVLKLTISLKLRNEALWGFLRTIMSSKDVPSSIVKDFVSEAKSIIDSDSERPRSRSIARSALKWLKTHG